MIRTLRYLAAALTVSILLTASASAEEGDAFVPPADSILLTVFLKHDQSKTLDEIGALLAENDFYEHFPPEGVDIVSWKIVMGVGHVVTLRVPPEKLRAVNVALERRAWKAFRTEFYPTYDFRPVRKRMLAEEE